MAYKRIKDYGLISDSLTAALVGLDGSIDWMCWPRFDSQAVFSSLLDDKKGGFFKIAPVANYESGQKYIKDTNVLVTEFKTETGKAELIDFIDIERQEVFRIIKCSGGRVSLKIDFAPRFDYGQAPAALKGGGGSVTAESGGVLVELRSQAPLEIGARAATGRLEMRAGDQKALVVGSSLSTTDPDLALKRTIAYWRDWANSCSYDGPWKDWVTRSALVIKALTYRPTGQVVAAPTTSLPEQIGGGKNWDYRYSWLRDAAMVLEAMFHLGHMADEGGHFLDFLVDKGGKDLSNLHIMYDIDGRPLEEKERILEKLDGYRGSRPVRIGNEAGVQFQLDVYGEILYAAHRFADFEGRLTPRMWGAVTNTAEHIIRAWKLPDSGIWEERGRGRHYTQSKAMCAVGLRAALRTQEKLGYAAPTRRWRQALAEIRKTVLDRGWNSELNSFTKVFGTDELDASLLLLSVYDFLPAHDPRMRSTVDRLIHTLGRKGFMYRFQWPGEGLEEGEGAFAIATMWLAMHFIRLGKVDFAIEYIDAIVGTANHLGLFAEEFDPRTGDFLGNFPQLFVHAALIDVIHNVDDFMNKSARETSCVDMTP